MKLSDILKNVEMLETGVSMNMEISDICSDSRSVTPGAAFVAIVGFETDGHKYIPSAIEKGASVIICQQKPEGLENYVLVADSRKALAQCAANFYGHPADSMTMVGVTGTNGKTSITWLLKSVLESRGAKVGLIGTIQNMIGQQELPTERTTPESNELQKLFRQMLDEGCTHVIMEVSSHALELSRVEGVHFKVGVFTNLTEDHLDFHKTMENYLAAKAKLFSMCDVGVINMDDAAYETLKESARCQVFSYSVGNEDADLVAMNVRLKPASVEFEALLPYHIARVELGIPGQFSVYNALAVIGAAVQMDIPLRDAAAALKSASGVKGRVEVVPTGTDYTMIIDYAHTPDALENVLKTLRGFAQGRVVALFGCGGDRDPIKRPIMGRIAMELADFVIFTSDNPRTEEPKQIIKDILAGTKKLKTPHKVIEDRRAAIRWAMENAQPGDVILLAGKGHETYQILGKEKVHLDEREEIAKVLEDLKK